MRRQPAAKAPPLESLAYDEDDPSAASSEAMSSMRAVRLMRMLDNAEVDEGGEVRRSDDGAANADFAVDDGMPSAESLLREKQRAPSVHPTASALLPPVWMHRLVRNGAAARAAEPANLF